MLRRLLLPKEGSRYTHKRIGCAYNGMSGVVHHHGDGKAFMIQTDSGAWLVNIKPLLFGLF